MLLDEHLLVAVGVQPDPALLLQHAPVVVFGPERLPGEVALHRAPYVAKKTPVSSPKRRYWSSWEVRLAIRTGLLEEVEDAQFALVVGAGGTRRPGSPAASWPNAGSPGRT